MSKRRFPHYGIIVSTCEKVLTKGNPHECEISDGWLGCGIGFGAPRWNVAFADQTGSAVVAGLKGEGGIRVIIR